MKKYKKIMIYTDPVGQRLKEGEAYLIKKLWEEKDLEFWKVEFVTDGFRCNRFIKKRDKREISLKKSIETSDIIA